MMFKLPFHKASIKFLKAKVLSQFTHLVKIVQWNIQYPCKINFIQPKAQMARHDPCCINSCSKLLTSTSLIIQESVNCSFKQTRCDKTDLPQYFSMNRLQNCKVQSPAPEGTLSVSRPLAFGVKGHPSLWYIVSIYHI